MSVRRGSGCPAARWIPWILLATLCCATRAHADVGAGRLALPSADRVLVPTEQHAPLAVAASAGYGVTESQAGEGAHHRAAGDLALAVGLAPNVLLSLAFEGRYDRHPHGDDGALSLPQLSLLGGLEVARGLRIGAGVLLSVPGGSAPSLELRAPILTMTALAAWSRRDFTLAAQAGFRLDQGARAAPDVSRLSDADRLALGLSDFNALPLGLAAFQRLDPVELFGELSGELLVGKRAPALLRSPLRAALGVRLPLLGGVSGEALAEVGLSQRPDYRRVGPLIPIEPRFGFMFGLRYVPGRSAADLAHTPVRQVQLPAAAPRTELSGRVLDPEGVPLHGVRLSALIDSEQQSAVSAEDGSFAFSELPEGAAQITAEGDGLIATRQSLELHGPRMQVALRVARVVEGAQLRGLVRSFAARPLPAQVRVLPAGRVVRADKDGRFVLELPAGDYEVEIECDGYLTQRRKVSVHDNGVTLLDVELHEAP